jgi:hypothetical protein
MIVVLMRSQHNALTSVTAGTMWAEVLANIVGTSGERDRQSLHVEAPAIAWATLRDHMMQRTFKTSGARAKVPSGWISSTKRLATSVAKMEAHPCWTGVGLPGTLAEVFPAWRGTVRDPRARARLATGDAGDVVDPRQPPGGAGRAR